MVFTSPLWRLEQDTGTFEGNTIEGTIEGGRGGGRPFTGMRGG